MLAFDGWIYPLAATVIVVVVALVIRAISPIRFDITIHHDKENTDEQHPDSDR